MSDSFHFSFFGQSDQNTKKSAVLFLGKMWIFIQKTNKHDRWFFRFWSLWPKNEKWNELHISSLKKYERFSYVTYFTIILYNSQSNNSILVQKKVHKFIKKIVRKFIQEIVQKIIWIILRKIVQKIVQKWSKHKCSCCLWIQQIKANKDHFETPRRSVFSAVSLIKTFGAHISA